MKHSENHFLRLKLEVLFCVFVLADMTFHFRAVVDPSSKCKRWPIEPGHTCNFMQEKLAKTKDTCAQYQPAHICFKNSSRASINCSFARHFCDVVQWGVISGEDGTTLWYPLAEHVYSFEAQLKKLFASHKFLFLMCTLNKNGVRKAQQEHLQYDEILNQLRQLLWRRQDYEAGKSPDVRPEGKPNINIIFIDSVSRTAFYEQLKQTVHYLKGAAERRQVLDFHLFQSISRSTRLHMEQLFGYVPAENETQFIKEYYFVKAAPFFQSFRQQGYFTLYSLDWCYRNFYFHTSMNSLPRNVTYSDAKHVWSRIDVDDEGLFWPQCDLLRYFTDSDDSLISTQKCLNGRQLAELHLLYAMETQKVPSFLAS